MAKKKTTITDHKAAIGVGLAALAATAAGVYFMTGKNSKNRKKAATWIKDMHKDIMKDLKEAKNMTKEAYNEIIDQVGIDYQQLKNISTKDLAIVSAELKQNWDAIKAEIDKAQTKVKKVTKKVKQQAKKKTADSKKVVKKAVKKSAKKAAKKAPKKTAKKK